MRSIALLSVAYKPFRLSVIILIVVAPKLFPIL
jgi:hypothetical protein